MKKRKRSNRTTKTTPGETFNYREINDVIHGRVRLSIMAYLSGAGEADFTLLRAKVGVTDGNLSVHMHKLEEAGYLDVKKIQAGARPQTLCRLTAKGREAWIAYIGQMESLMRPRAAE